MGERKEESIASIYSWGRYRVGIGRGKEDKEYIEGNRGKKCPGETRRSSVYWEKIERSLGLPRRLSRTPSTPRAIDSKHFLKLRSTPLTANSSAVAQRGVTRNASSISRVHSSRDVGVSKTFSHRLHSLSLFLQGTSEIVLKSNFNNWIVWIY